MQGRPGPTRELLEQRPVEAQAGAYLRYVGFARVVPGHDRGRVAGRQVQQGEDENADDQHHRQHAEQATK